MWRIKRCCFERKDMTKRNRVGRAGGRERFVSSESTFSSGMHVLDFLSCTVQTYSILSLACVCVCLLLWSTQRARACESQSQHNHPPLHSFCNNPTSVRDICQCVCACTNGPWNHGRSPGTHLRAHQHFQRWCFLMWLHFRIQLTLTVYNKPPPCSRRCACMPWWDQK